MTAPAEILRQGPWSVKHGDTASDRDRVRPMTAAAWTSVVVMFACTLDADAATQDART
jgi:hypothetical protein